MRLLRILCTYLLVAATAVVLLLIDLWPWRPSSRFGWLVLALLALPILIAGDWVGDKLLGNPVSHAVDRSTARIELSWLRVAYLLTLVLVLIVTALLFGYFWSR
jgi:hypothetical protein